MKCSEEVCWCGNPVTEDQHQCPYQVDVNGDAENYCNCCADCEEECGWAI